MDGSTIQCNYQQQPSPSRPAVLTSDVPEHLRFVEVPVIKEEIIHVPKKEFVEYETRVPVYDYQIREKIVEVPQVETISREMELEQVREVVKRVSIKQRIEVPKEVVKYVTKIVTKVVEQEVEVPGDLIKVPKPFKVEKTIIVPRYTNREVPAVVSQLIQPVLSESEEEVVEVVLKEYEPYLIPVEVYIPRPVEREVVLHRVSEQRLPIDVPPSQFNALVKATNTGATDQDVDGLLVKHLDGSIPMLNLIDYQVQVPTCDDWRSAHIPGQLRISEVPGQNFLLPQLARDTNTDELLSAR